MSRDATGSNELPMWLVVGASSPIGRHVAQQLPADRLMTADFHPVPGVSARGDFEGLGDEFAQRARDREWRVVWAIGAGEEPVSGSQLLDEGRCLDAFLRALRPLDSSGVFTLTSSAAGLYADALNPPFTEHDRVSPELTHGRSQLEHEWLTAALMPAGSRLLICRYPHVFGLGKNLVEPFGVVNQAVVSTVRRQPLVLRAGQSLPGDYVYAADAAAVLIAATRRLALEPVGAQVTKLISGGASMSLVQVLAELARVSRRRVPIHYELGEGPEPDPELRLNSVVWADLDEALRTPFPAAVAQILADAQSRLR